MQTTQHSEAGEWLRRRLRDADPDLDADVDDWYRLVAGAPRLGLLGAPVLHTVDKASQPPPDEPACLVVLQELALRPLGASDEQLLDGLRGRPGAAADTVVLPDLLATARDWLGTYQRSGRPHLQTVGRGRAAVHRLSGVLVDVDLVRRLRLRAACWHSGTLTDLVAAHRLLPPQAPPAPAVDQHVGAGWLTAGALRPATADLVAHLAKRGHVDVTPVSGARRAADAGAEPNAHPAQKWRARPSRAEPRPDAVAAHLDAGLHNNLAVSATRSDHDEVLAAHRPGCRPGCLGAWILPEIGRSHSTQCALHGGDLEADGTLLPLSALAQHLHALAAAARTPARGTLRMTRRPSFGLQPDTAHGAIRSGGPLPHSQGDLLTPRQQPAVSLGSLQAGAARLPHTAPTIGHDDRVVAVVSAHGWAGASTFALALSDAAGARGCAVQLVSLQARGAGLEAACDAELGENDGWRTGRRGRAVHVGRAAERPADSAWRQHIGVTAGLIVLDCPTGAPPPTAGPVLAVVARVSIPGLRAVEEFLAGVAPPVAPHGHGRPAVPLRLVIAVGPQRWPGPVAASVGSCLRQLREDGLVIAVPLDRELAMTGVTSAPLPRAVTAAAGRVLRHLPAPPPPSRDDVPGQLVQRRTDVEGTCR